MGLLPTESLATKVYPLLFEELGELFIRVILDVHGLPFVEGFHILLISSKRVAADASELEERLAALVAVVYYVGVPSLEVLQ